MDAHEALRHRRQYFALAEQQFRKADLAARIGDVVDCHLPVEPGPGLVGQRFPGSAQIGEFGFAAAPWHVVGVKHGQGRRNPAKGAIGMPEPVAELIEPARVVSSAQSVVLVEVRYVGDLGAQSPLPARSSTARRLDLAEMPGEGELPLVVEMLVP
jgi:hypothetical protein